MCDLYLPSETYAPDGTEQESGPHTKRKLLDDPEIRKFGRTAPEYLAPAVPDGPDQLYSPLREGDKVRALLHQIEAKTTPRTQRAM